MEPEYSRSGEPRTVVLNHPVTQGCIVITVLLSIASSWCPNPQEGKCFPCVFIPWCSPQTRGFSWWVQKDMMVELAGCDVAESVSTNIVPAAWVNESLIWGLHELHVFPFKSQGMIFFFLLVLLCRQSSLLSFSPSPPSKPKRDYQLHLPVYNLKGKLNKTGPWGICFRQWIVRAVIEKITEQWWV